ncbi:SAP domain-containing protein [Euphorbia peplus]|nr:SAP domain-containing protein [Euphorbia peplus]
MEALNQQNPHLYHEEDDDDDVDYPETGGSDSDSDWDIEETQGHLSNLSIKTNSISRICKIMDEGFKSDTDRDKNSVEQVQKIIQAGEVEKLKVEQCKVYLRKNGLRLTGNKETLILRIKEHQESLNGSGEKKYPVSSFVSNCKGFSTLGDTQGHLPNLSIKKKSISRMCKELDEGFESNPETVDMNVEEVDEKSFEEVQKIIAADEIEKLKMEQSKVYLRKYGLRLTGNKETLILRIKEHQEISNGRGEKKYPVSSFVLNCKGDACTGDVVMFEQNVYEMFSIASRSASGPPIGTRIIVGRIVKESYGAAKQQHTFTIEVLWSKGEKPLPPLHPLLIKGRNLYRLKTLRQKWDDEGERQKVLLDKHSRGSLARSARESRIQDKQAKKTLRENKGLKKERNRKGPQSKSNQGIQMQQQSSSSVHLQKAAPEPQMSALSMHNSGSYFNVAKQTIGVPKPANNPPVAINPATTVENRFLEMHHRQPLTSMNSFHPTVPFPETIRENVFKEKYRPQLTSRNDFYPIPSNRQPLTSMNSFHPTVPLPGTTREKVFKEKYRPRLTRGNDFHPILLNRQSFNKKQQQQCKYYPQGRCYYGDNCKFLHDHGQNLQPK